MGDDQYRLNFVFCGRPGQKGNRPFLHIQKALSGDRPVSFGIPPKLLKPLPLHLPDLRLGSSLPIAEIHLKQTIIFSVYPCQVR